MNRQPTGSQHSTNMKHLLEAIFVAITSVLALTANATTPAVIPAPQKMELRDGEFKLTPQTRIYVDSASRETGRFLAGQLRRSTGYPFKVSTKSGAGAASGAILLTTKEANAALGDEGYELTVAPDSVVIRAPAQAGVSMARNRCCNCCRLKFFHQSRQAAWNGRCRASGSKTSRDSSGAGSCLM